MNEFQDLLERRARGVEPSSEALQTILRTVGRRRRTRRVLSAMAATALIAAGTFAVAAPMLGHAPTKLSSWGPPQVADALSIRRALGIEGPTKGAPQSVVVRHEGPGDQVQLSLVKIQTGQATPLPRNVREATVSPGGDLALLFGVTYRHHGEPRPHLFLGRFDGTAVTGLTRIEVSRGAVDGPMGWLGENAFLLAPADGEALIVRIDGTRVQVNANPMTNPCDYLPPAAGCTRSGPLLLGTNDGGSLLFWRL